MIENNQTVKVVLVGNEGIGKVEHKQKQFSSFIF